MLGEHTLANTAALLAGEDDEHARRFGWFPARSTDRTVEAAIERWEEQWRTSGATRAFAARECVTSTLVGGCEIRLGDDRVAAMSYWVFPFARRRGYATRALALACRYAFSELEVRLIELHIAAGNTASREVARRALRPASRTCQTRRARRRGGALPSALTVTPALRLGSRWRPSRGRVTIALVPTRDGVPTGGETDIHFTTGDAAAARADLQTHGVDVGKLLRWPGVPLMFAVRDQDGTASRSSSNPEYGRGPPP